jgi:type I restriction enzyme, S subunit
MKQGWEVKKLGDLATFSQGIQVGLKDQKSEPSDGYVRFIRIVDYTQNTEDLRYVKDPGEKYFVNEDDLVMVRYGTPGLIGRGKRGVIANNLFQISLGSKGICNDYMDYYLSQKHIQTYLSTQGSSTMPALNFSQLKEVLIIFPPLPEQKRIVVILDKCFADIDKAKQNLEKNLQNAKDLFQSQLNQIFSQKGEGWEEKKLGDISNVTYGFTDKSLDDGDFRYVRITDINNDGELTSAAKKYVKSSDDGKNFILQENDILMARTGATFAKLLLYKDLEPSIFASYLIKIDFTEDIENELYWFYSKSSSYWNQANSLSSGAAQPHFNGKALKQVIFPYPKVKDQQIKLIEKFRNLKSKIQSLESNYQQQLDALEELKKSLLQKAFNGEL